MIWQLCKIIHTNTWVSYSRGHYISLLSYDSRNNFIGLHDRDLVKYTRCDRALRCDHVLPELLLATYIIDFSWKQMGLRETTHVLVAPYIFRDGTTMFDYIGDLAAKPCL